MELWRDKAAGRSAIKGDKMVGDEDELAAVSTREKGGGVESAGGVVGRAD